MKQVFRLPFNGVVGGNISTTDRVFVIVPCVAMFGLPCPIERATRPWLNDPSKADVTRPYRVVHYRPRADNPAFDRIPNAEELAAIEAMFYDSLAGKPFDTAKYGGIGYPAIAMETLADAVTATGQEVLTAMCAKLDAELFTDVDSIYPTR